MTSLAMPLFIFLLNQQNVLTVKEFF